MPRDKVDFTLPQAFRVTDLLAHQFPPQQYWWGPNILPKSAVAMIGGPSGVGKSFVSLSVIRALTLGIPVFNDPLFDVPRQTRVLYMDQEVAPQGLQERVRKSFTPEESQRAGDYFFALSGNPDISFSSQAGFDLILENVERIKPEVLILDPIANLHNYDENSNTEIGLLFKQVNKIKSVGLDWGLSVIIVHHTKKPAEGADPLSAKQARGASVFEAVMDGVLMMEFGKYLTTEQEAWTLRCRFDKVRHGRKPPEFWLTINEHGNFRAELTRWAGSSFAGGMPQMKVPVPSNPFAPQVVVPAPPSPPTSGPVAIDIPLGPKIKTF